MRHREFYFGTMDEHGFATFQQYDQQPTMKEVLQNVSLFHYAPAMRKAMEDFCRTYQSGETLYGRNFQQCRRVLASIDRRYFDFDEKGNAVSPLFEL